MRPTGQRRHQAFLLLDSHRLRPTHRPTPLTIAWRWRHETLLLGALTALAWLAWTTDPVPVTAITTGVLAIALLDPGLRRTLTRRTWCVITEHRIRVACDQARIHARNGRLPAVLRVRPSDHGELVTVWTPAGTSTDDYHTARNLIATACWAHDVHIHPHPRRPHLITLHVIRRPPGQPRTTHPGEAQGENASPTT